MKCVNLKRQFGELYRVECEESYFADRGARARLEDPWLMILLCQNGHICPWGDSMLAACTNFDGTVARQLRKLPYTTVVQDGDDGVNVTFDVEHFDEIAEIMKPRRRRRLSEAQKKECVERLRPHWPAKGETVWEAAAQHAETTQECDPEMDLV